MKPQRIAFSAVSLGCISLAFQVVGCAGSESPVSIVTSVPEVEPDAVISASFETLELTNGVTSWKVYTEDEQAIRVLGVNAHALVITETRLHMAIDDDNNLLGVIVESVLPEGGSALIGLDGLVGESTIDAHAASASVLRAMGSDFQSVGDAQTVRLPSWGCTRATAKMLAVCGAGIATCVGSHGLTCIEAGTLCYDTARNFMCKCRGRHC